jgi:glycosyltransferase involved in cell wall biosynthesis
MIEQRPLVSIGIPVYNGEKLLHQALDALLVQTYTNLEFVIVNNASTDRTEEICHQYAAKDPRIRYYRNETNIGVYANFRRVIELSRGAYFMWAAVDDLRAPTVIEDCVKALLENPQAVLAHGLILAETTAGPTLLPIANTMDLALDDAIERVRNFTRQISSSAIHYGLFRREALVQGWLGSCYGQDYILCLQMCLLGPFVYIKTPMMISRRRKPTLTLNPMYAPVPLTFKNLIRVYNRPQRKCWVVLFMGCYYLFQLQSVSLTKRGHASILHVVTFSQRYSTLLVKEVVFSLFIPISFLASVVWRGVRQVAALEPVVHRVQALLRS